MFDHLLESSQRTIVQAQGLVKKNVGSPLKIFLSIYMYIELYRIFGS